jgi:hypothetical protein
VGDGRGVHVVHVQVNEVSVVEGGLSHVLKQKIRNGDTDIAGKEELTSVCVFLVHRNAVNANFLFQMLRCITIKS